MRGPALALVVLLAGCAGSAPAPVAIDTRHDACDGCRMAISDVHFAAQIVARSEEPLRFDDIGCMRDWLEGHGNGPRGAVAWVADHGSGAWVRAADAVYTQVEGRRTPMGSGLLAHADAASRDADPEAAAGQALRATDVFGAAGPPRGAP